MLSAIFITIGNGIMFGTVFSVYTKILGGSNQALGFIATIGGLFATISIFPGGILADKINRGYLVRTGALFTLIGFLFILTAIDIRWLYLAQIFLGIASGLTGPAVESLLADSLASGYRDKTYAQIYFIRNGLSAFGPFFATGLFFFLGDEWSLDVLRQVILSGTILTAVGITIQSFLSEQDTLGLESESIYQQTQTQTETQTQTRAQAHNIRKSSANHKPIENSLFIPTFLVCMGIIIGLGAGMTIQFFPIFFKELYSLQPTAVTLIFGFTALATGTLGLLAPKIAEKVGRIETMFLVQLVGIVCLVIIAQIPPLFIIVPVFIMRSAFQNASEPLHRSLVMDRVPKRHRGKWNALEGIAFGLLWSISAGIGGVLLDRYSFVFLYYITTSLYICGTLPLLLIRQKVKLTPNIVQKAKITT
jgi:MFS family permease